MERVYHQRNMRVSSLLCVWPAQMRGRNNKIKTLLLKFRDIFTHRLFWMLMCCLLLCGQLRKQGNIALSCNRTRLSRCWEHWMALGWHCLFCLPKPTHECMCLFTTLTHVTHMQYGSTDQLIDYQHLNTKWMSWLCQYSLALWIHISLRPDTTQALILYRSLFMSKFRFSNPTGCRSENPILLKNSQWEQDHGSQGVWICFESGRGGKSVCDSGVWSLGLRSEEHTSELQSR